MSRTKKCQCTKECGCEMKQKQKTKTKRRTKSTTTTRRLGSSAVTQVGYNAVGRVAHGAPLQVDMRKAESYKPVKVQLYPRDFSALAMSGYNQQPTGKPSGVDETRVPQTTTATPAPSLAPKVVVERMKRPERDLPIDRVEEAQLSSDARARQRVFRQMVDTQELNQGLVRPERVEMSTETYEEGVTLQGRPMTFARVPFRRARTEWLRSGEPIGEGDRDIIRQRLQRQRERFSDEVPESFMGQPPSFQMTGTHVGTPEGLMQGMGFARHGGGQMMHAVGSGEWYNTNDASVFKSGDKRYLSQMADMMRARLYQQQRNDYFGTYKVGEIRSIPLPNASDVGWNDKPMAPLTANISSKRGRPSVAIVDPNFKKVGQKLSTSLSIGEQFRATEDDRVRFTRPRVQRDSNPYFNSETVDMIVTKKPNRVVLGDSYLPR